MSNPSIYIYPSLGGSFSMKRYLDGVVHGLKSNQITYQVIRPSGNGLISKYIVYPFLTFRKRNRNAKHLIISERYAFLIPWMGKKSIVVCHDLHSVYTEAKTSFLNKIIYRLFLRSMFYADKVVCISEHTKKDLLRYYPKYNRHKHLKVVHNGIEDYWSDRSLDEHDTPTWSKIFESKKVLLSVGIDAWYKNNSWSLNLLAQLGDDFHLLRIGGFNESNERLIKSLGLQPRITQITNISDNQLKLAYQKAMILLFPSITEGFGWPALEASLNGCPVASDGRGATSELFHNAYELISLTDVKERLELDSLCITKPNYILWIDQVKMLLS